MMELEGMDNGLTRVKLTPEQYKLGLRLLSNFIELKSMTISEIAKANDITPGNVVLLMCGVMEEDKRIMEGLKRLDHE